MKRSEHKCAVPTCENPCPREYPFCATCWRKVPAEQRVRVREELAKRGTPDMDRSGIYYAVTAAAASAGDVPQWTPETLSWERAWRAAGSPELEVIG